MRAARSSKLLCAALCLAMRVAGMAAAAKEAAKEAAAAAAAARGGQPFLQGATFGVGQYGNPRIPLTAAASDDSLRELAAAGANAVAFPVVWYVNATNATTMFPMPGDAAADSNSSRSSPLRTVTDAELDHAVQLARQLRLSVTLQLVVDLNWDLPGNVMSFDPVYPGADCLFYGIKKQLHLPVPPEPPVCPSQPTSRAFLGCGSVEGGGGGGAGGAGEGGGAGRCVAPFSAAQWDAWFASYRAFAVHYAALAQRWGVDWLGISSGLDTAHHAAGPARWQALAAAIRTEFTAGRLTATVAVTSAATAAAELGAVQWWNATDAVGVELQVPLASATGDVAELVAAWEPAAAALRQFSQGAAGRPVLLTRWGYQSRIAAWAHPAGAPRDGDGADCSVYMRCSSMSAQARAYEAFFRVFSPPPVAAVAGASSDGSGADVAAGEGAEGWLAGAFLWLWRNDPSQGGTSGDDYTPVGKPALAVASRFWANASGTHARAGPGATTTGLTAAAAEADGGATTVLSAPARLEQAQRQRGWQQRRQQSWTGKQNGICFGIGEWSSTESPSADLNSSEARQSLRDAVAHGVNSVEFIPTLFFPNESSTEIYAKPAASSLRTPSDAELSSIVAYAKELGLRTVLSPMFDPDYELIANGTGDPGAGRAAWGAHMDDAWIAQWFANYGGWIRHYAALAAELGMDSFHAMHELHTMGTNASLTPQWRALLGDVRALFPGGELSVAFNGNPFFDDVASGGIGYIDLLDSIGLDCYWPLVTATLPAEPWGRPGADAVAAAWQPWVDKMKHVVTDVYPGKHIVCTEIGYQSRPYAWVRGMNQFQLNPRDCSVYDQCINMGAQADAIEGLVQALYPHDWFDGVYLWLWRADPSAGGSSDASYTPQGKEAAEVLKRLWK